MLLPAIATAGTASAPMQVSAYVAPRATLEAVTALPSSINVEAADIAAGYKDVAATYRVRSNDPRGYYLRFDTRAGLTGAIVVTGLVAPFTVGALGAEVLEQPVARVQDYTLGFRLPLSAAARPGTYPLPVVLGVETL